MQVMNGMCISIILTGRIGLDIAFFLLCGSFRADVLIDSHSVETLIQGGVA